MAQQVADASDEVGHGQTRAEADAREQGEIERGRVQRERAGDEGGEGELEGHQAGGVVHEALAFEDGGQA